EATLTIGSALTIKTQPEDVTTPADQTVYFSVEMEGGNEGYTFQWQTKLNETSDWANTGLTGAKTATLTVKPTAVYDGRQYRCVITDANKQTVTSDAATLTITVPTTIEIEDVTYDRLTETTVTVKSYAGTAAILVIPQTVESNGVTYTVTEIGEAAFKGNTYLESIDLPDTITVIRSQAFMNCTNLREMK
ncbi:MAG: leucine-rich repeat protein, partial [Clostridia bacterium]|nr:leucine-rich repeat protein [Clostridia bacterium]